MHELSSAITGQPIAKLNSTYPCTRCGGYCLPTLYGMPSEPQDPTKIKLMGCDISGEIYSWYCPGCVSAFSKGGGKGQHEAALAWLVQGAVAWFANNRKLPSLPKEVLADLDEWRSSQDSLGSFLKANVEIDPASWVAQADLHQLFKIEQGEDELSDVKSFTSALKSHEFILSNGLRVKTRLRSDSPELSRPNPLNNPWLSTSPLAKQTTMIKGLRFKQ